MNTQTLLLLAVVAVIVSYASFASPTVGAAIAIAATVVGVLHLIVKDDSQGNC